MITTGVIKSLRDEESEPEGILIPSMNTVNFIMEWLYSRGGYRLVLWRGNFYAVAK